MKPRPFIIKVPITGYIERTIYAGGEKEALDIFNEFYIDPINVEELTIDDSEMTIDEA